MDHPPVAAKICILKVNMHCKECERRVTRSLRKVEGVHSVVVDGDSGKVKVMGNMDPYVLIRAFKKIGKIAEILQYMDALPVPERPLSPPATPADNQNQPNERASHQSSTDQNQVIAETAHLQNPSKINKMKQEELTHSKSRKVTIKDSGNGTGPKNNIVTGDVQPHHHNGDGASGGSSSVASSSSNQEPPMTGGEGGGPSTEQTSKPIAYTYNKIIRYFRRK